MKHLTAIFLMAAYASSARAEGHFEPQTRAISPADGWQQCAALQDQPQARLACFDHWAQAQARPATANAVPAAPEAVTPRQAALPAAAEPPAPADCRSGPQSLLSRYWELEAGSDCGRFNIRGYKPITLSLAHADGVNSAPSSPTPGHTASPQPYLQNEMRMQLSIRTKIGQGLLPVEGSGGRDSLWFGYTQQSLWQLFTSSLSRPFRNTDHEPELIYIVPTDVALPAGWRLRYSGVSLNHQSNGQSQPLSRSWNRGILMAGMEKDTRFTLTGRIWQRLGEGDDVDDNPDISDTVGRAEIAGQWHPNRDNTLGLTVRHSLTATANGSWRLEWLRALNDSRHGSVNSGLRLHVQLFSGYGDSLVDYNQYRNVLTVGLSLVDW